MFNLIYQKKMERKTHYQMVDRSIVFLTENCGDVLGDINSRLNQLFEGVIFRNTVTGRTQSAENVEMDIHISESNGDLFFLVKANLDLDTDVDQEIYFRQRLTTLQYIEGRFVHVEEFEYEYAQGTNVEMLLPGESAPSTTFEEYVLNNL